MLKNLTINNIVLIENEEINFNSGLCILSGETGSGKSILLDALGLTIGFRSNIRLIGSSERKASAIAEFDIKNNNICQEILAENELLNEEDKNILRIRRIIKEGNSKTFINDNPVGVNLLAKIGENLVEIHGQHDQRGLLNFAFHIDILDQFSGNEILLSEIKKIYQELKEIDRKIAEIYENRAKALREKDYLEYIINELENSNLEIGEEENLVSQREILQAQEKILDFINEVKNNLLEANSQLIQGQKILIRNQNIIDNYLKESGEEFNKINDNIDDQNIKLDSAIEILEDKIREISNSENNLDEIEERLLYIRSLSRKFNVSCNELPNIILDAQEKLKLINNEEEVSLDLKNKRAEFFKKYQEVAAKLSEKRKKFGEILSNKVEEELNFLKMSGTKFLVEIQQNNSEENQEKYFAKGYDKVLFKASLNNNNFDNIAKIASGGELSRFMLALKTALMDVKSTPTIIFDEIDTGIGGATANSVGERLKKLSKNIQILVVTHQPQIACKADLHLKISKENENGKVRTKVETLDENSKINEIARMLSGDQISSEAIAAAQKLLNK